MATVATSPVGLAPEAARQPHPTHPALIVLALVGGSALQLVEEVIEPKFADDTANFVWIAAHSTWHAVDIAIGLAAVPLLIATALILARLAWRMPRLARVGAAISVVGFCGLSAVHGFEAAGVALLDGGVSPETLAAATGHLQPALAVPLLAMFLGGVTIGLPMILVGLWRSRSVPRAAVAVLLAFGPVDFLLPDLPVPTHAVLFAGLTWMAVSLARRAAADPLPSGVKGQY